MCFTIKDVWYTLNSGWFSCLSKEDCVSLVWSIPDWDMVTCSFLKPGFHSSYAGFYWEKLHLWLFQFCCLFFWKNMLILVFMSVHETLNLLGDIFLCWFGFWVSFVISFYFDGIWDPAENQLYMLFSLFSNFSFQVCRVCYNWELELIMKFFLLLFKMGVSDLLH